MSVFVNNIGNWVEKLGWQSDGGRREKSSFRKTQPARAIFFAHSLFTNIVAVFSELCVYHSLVIITGNLSEHVSSLSDTPHIDQLVKREFASGPPSYG